MKHNDQFWRSRAFAKPSASIVGYRLLLELALVTFIGISALRLQQLLASGIQ